MKTFENIMKFIQGSFNFILGISLIGFIFYMIYLVVFVI